MLKVCQVKKCGGAHHAKGMCKAHYERMKETGSLIPKEKYPKICTYGGCVERTEAKGKCHYHYHKDYREARA